jgi:3-deoxy-D-manno-octulosonate 8-phosphate phosphatase (KDO 8-P phosphatase)
MKKDIKLFITDIDGVWTDDSIYYDKDGKETVKFNLNDSAGVYMLYLHKIPVVAISENKNRTIQTRMEKLKINDILLGISNKLTEIERLLEKHNLTWEEVAYIGNDINDIQLLKKAGLSAVPGQVPHYVKKHADFSLVRKGGEGAFREFVEKYLDAKGLLEPTINQLINLDNN